MTHPSTYPPIEALIPHRGKMRLIDEIVRIDGESAVSRAIPTDRWPTSDGTRVSSLLLIELVAQTSGLSNGLEWLNSEGEETKVSGWLVGIKKAEFLVRTLALGAVIEAEAKNSYKFEGFREIVGTCRLDGKIVGEIVLQVVRT